MLLPFQGVGLVLGIFIQGAALGYVLLPLRGVLFMSFDTPSYVVLPFGACHSWVLTHPDWSL